MSIYIAHRGRSSHARVIRWTSACTADNIAPPWRATEISVWFVSWKRKSDRKTRLGATAEIAELFRD